MLPMSLKALRTMHPFRIDTNAPVTRDITLDYAVFRLLLEFAF